jgi:hypothetical protein
MPSFTPPTEEGPQHLSRYGANPADRLFRHYPGQETGITVWRDPDGNYHQQQYPYQGGAEYRTFNDDEVTETADSINDSLAHATEVYMGGSTYEISEETAEDLIAAGFQVGGHFDSEEQKWIDYALVSQPNVKWKGGDAMASVVGSTGATAWTFSDTLVGTVDGEGFYIAALPQRNSCVVQDADGNIVSQIFASGSSGPAFAHPSPSTNWYWPLDIAVNGPGVDDTRIIMALEMFNDGVFGTIVGNTMLRLNAFVVVVETINYDNFDGKFRVYSVFNDTDFHYITGIEQTAPDDIDVLVNTPRIFDIRSYSRIARCPLGQLIDVGQWTFWNGTAWVSSISDATRLLNVDGSEIEGETSITKVGSNFLMCAISFGQPELRMYKSPNPQGPWTLYHVENTSKLPQKGLSPPKGRRYGYYQPKFHEHLNPSADVLVASYMRNTFNLSPDPGSVISDIHVSTFVPQFIYVPTPS